MSEQDAIKKALATANGRIDGAAKILGVSRRTLQNRMREYKMTRGKAGRPRRKLWGRHPRSWLAAGAAVTALAVGVGVAVARRGKGSST